MSGPEKKTRTNNRKTNAYFKDFRAWCFW